MPIHCLSDAQHEGVTIDAQHHHENVMLARDKHDSHSHATTQHDGNTSSSDAGRLCCNHVYTGAPSVALLPAPDMAFFAVHQISTVPPPFFPERLLRPPRT